MADIFSDAVNFVGATLRQKTSTANLKDYAHASRLFVGDNFNLVPKSSFLFHVYMDIDQSALQTDPNNPNAVKEIGLMVKSADLPKFSTESKIYNSYNRANIVQTKIKYDPITIVFNDDSSNLIRNFWISYFRHYYRDGDYSLSQDIVNQKYSDQRITDFGLTPRTATPYLRSIRIYSLHQKKFSEYILVNPIIKSFKHGTHTQGESDTMKHDMTVEYETVIYNGGTTSSGEIFGFAELHYDSSKSPITPVGGYQAPGKFGSINGANLVGAVVNKLIGGTGGNMYKALNVLTSLRSAQIQFDKLSNIVNGLGIGPSSNQVFVPNLPGTPGALNSPFNGINTTNTFAKLAVGSIATSRIPSFNNSGATILSNYNSTFPLTNLLNLSASPLQTSRVSAVDNSAITPLASQNITALTAYPLASTAISQVTDSDKLTLLNKQSNIQSTTTNQKKINLIHQKRTLEVKIISVDRQISDISKQIFETDSTIKNATATISALNLKYISVQSLPDTTPNKQLLLDQIKQNISLQNTIKTDTVVIYNININKVNTLTQELISLKVEKDTLV